jgi:hypothetical protein
VLYEIKTVPALNEAILWVSCRLNRTVLKDWRKQSASPGSQELGKNFYNETHRRSVPVKINGRSVGTLNASFRGDPSDETDEQIQRVLFHWAQNAKSDLVAYIKENLDYSEYSPSKS